MTVQKKMFKRFLPVLVVASHLWVLSAADLIVGSGETTTITTSAEYGTIKVNGTLAISSSAVVKAAEIYVGVDGGTGTLNLESGAELTASSGIYIGSNTAEGFADPHGEVNVTGAILNGTVNFSKNTSSDGTKVDDSSPNILTLGPGAELHGQIRRYNDMPAVVCFAGGRYFSRNGSPAYIDGNGRLTMSSVDGADIYLDLGREHRTLGQLSSGSKGIVVMEGSGDFKLFNAGSSVDNPMHLGSVDWRSFNGEVILDKYGMRLFSPHQLDGAAPRRYVLAGADSQLVLCKGNHVIGSITGAGFLKRGDESGFVNIDAPVAQDEFWRLASRDFTIDKFDGATLSFPGFTPQRVRVREGTVSFPQGLQPLTYRHFRFKIDKARILNNEGLVQISEIKLFNGEEDVTGLRTSFECGSSAYRSANSPDRVLDNNLDTKWIPECDSAKNPIYETMWIGLFYAEGQHVTSYSWATANDAGGNPSYREPISWRLQASDDGETWIDLDVQADYPTTSDRKTYVGLFEATEPEDATRVMDLEDTTRAVVWKNGMLAFGMNRVVRLDSLVNLGAMTYGEGDQLVLGSDGTDSFVVNPRFSGTGDMVKEGDNTVTVDGPSTHTGRVIVRDGKLVFRNLPQEGFRHYRFQLTGTRSVKNAPDALMQFSELKLYNGETDVTPLRSGWSCGSKSHHATWMPDKVLDGALDTKWVDMTFRDEGDWSNCWIQVDYAEAQPLTAYAFYTANDATWRDPGSWRLMASSDGDEWYVIDEVIDYVAPEERKALAGSFGLSDTSGIVGEQNRTAFPEACEVSVAAGAELDLSSTRTDVGVLNVDMSAGAGTIRGFRAAANGELRLVNVPDDIAVKDIVVPLMFEDVQNATRLGSWKVLFDGQIVLPADNDMHIKGGCLKFFKSGFVFVVR